MWCLASIHRTKAVNVVGQGTRISAWKTAAQMLTSDMLVWGGSSVNGLKLVVDKLDGQILLLICSLDPPFSWPPYPRSSLLLLILSVLKHLFGDPFVLLMCRGYPSWTLILNFISTYMNTTLPVLLTAIRRAWLLPPTQPCSSDWPRKTRSLFFVTWDTSLWLRLYSSGPCTQQVLQELSMTRWSDLSFCHSTSTRYSFASECFERCKIPIYLRLTWDRKHRSSQKIPGSKIARLLCFVALRPRLTTRLLGTSCRTRAHAKIKSVPYAQQFS